MDALIVSVPFVGHLNPLLALSRELHARGLRVAVASLASARAHVVAEAPELSFIDLGTDENLCTAMNGVLEDASRDPNVARGAFRLSRGLLEMWPRMFDALSAALSTDRPRMIVADLFSPAGICAAQEHQIPLVVNNSALLHMLPMAVLSPAPHVPLAMTGRSIQQVGMLERIFAGVAPFLEPLIARLSGERRLNQLRHARGLPPVDMGGRLKATRIIVDDAFGFEYERALPPTVTMVGPMWSRAVPPLSSDDAAWLADGPPVVYANLGTVAVPDAKQLAAMRDAFDATTFRVLWVLRGVHAARLQGPLPPNVSLLEWGPPPRAVLAS
ncbi:MAG TPA: glycosyltransferase, partial [Candidatus Cybelea sp.]